MPLYIRYISKNIVPPLLTLTLVLTCLVWITQTLRLIHLIDKGMEVMHFVRLTFLLIPTLLFMILPVITLLAVIFTYNKLQDERQLIILKNSGINGYRLAKPALLVSGIVMIISFYISLYLMPLAYGTLKKEMNNFGESYVSSIIEPRTFNQVSKFINIYIDKKQPDGTMEGMLLFDNKIPQERAILFAKKGRIITSENNMTEFHLEDGLRHSYDQKGNLTKLYFDSLVVSVNYEEPGDANRSRKSMELYLDEMFWPDQSLSEEMQRRLITDGHLRLIWPLFNMAFVFVGLSIFLAQPYNRKSHIRQYIYTFAPVLFASYIHFTMQKFAYWDLSYIFFCYLNVIACIIFGIWQSNRDVL